MERASLEENASPQRSHVQEDLQRRDVQFPYGSHDASSQGSLPFGLTLAPTSDATPYREATEAEFSNTPVLVTRGSTTKGTKGPLVCHVEGCQRDLSLEKKYYKRYRVCMEHLKMNAIYVDGEMQRFCQQCGRFHDLSKFDGEKRNCRERLNQHNRRRRKSKRDAQGSDGSLDDQSSGEPAGKMQKGRRSKRLSQKTSSVWPGEPSGFEEGSHGMTSEEQQALGSVGMDMMHGIPVGTSAGVHPYGEGMPALTSPETQQTLQERESLYNMVVHHVVSKTSNEGTSDSRVHVPVDNTSADVVTSGTEAVHNLTTLLHVPEAAAAAARVSKTEGAQQAPMTGVQQGVNMLQSVSFSAPGNSMSAVPMLVFPSTSAPHQLNAVAIIPSATSSCSTLVSLPWHAAAPAPAPPPTMSAPVPSLPVPMQMSQPIEPTPNAAPGESGSQIPPLVSLALSASGIAQAAGPHAGPASISQNQLAHFQMLMARQAGINQSSGVAIPDATAKAVKARFGQEGGETKDAKREDDTAPSL